MARRPTLKREDIVAAARHVFGRYGYRKATMEDIARAAHKGKSSIYHYFERKEDVFRAVVEGEARMLMGEATRAVDGESTAEGKLRAYIVTRIRVFNRIVGFYRTFREEYFESYGALQRIRADLDRGEVKKIEELLRYGLDQGVFELPNPGEIAEALVTALRSFEYAFARTQDTAAVEKTLGNLTDLLFRGLVKR